MKFKAHIQAHLTRDGLILIMGVLTNGIMLTSSSGAEAQNLVIIDTIPLLDGETPISGNHLALSPDGSTLYMTSGRSIPTPENLVLVVDVGSKEVVSTIPAGTLCLTADFAITPDGSRAYMPESALRCAGTAPSRIEVIDTSTNTRLTPILTGGSVFGPTGVAVTPDGSGVYVTHLGDSVVHVIDTASNTLVANVALGIADPTQMVGIAITPDGTRAYASNRLNDAVSVIDTASNTEIATVPLSLASTNNSTSWIAITPDGSRAYVTNHFSSKVSALDIDPSSPTFHTELAVIPTTGTILTKLTITSDGRVALIVTEPGGILVIDTDPSSPTYHTQIGTVSVPLGSRTVDIIPGGPSGPVAYVSLVDNIGVISQLSEPTTFLLIDEDSIDSDEPGIEATADALGVDPGDLVNEDIADKGVRDVLPIPVGTILTLRTGEVGDEGVFALKTILASWDAAGPTADGLQNYIQAGPGLGTGEDPEVLLDKIPDVTPLRTAGLTFLAEDMTTVCAVVYKSDISINYDPLNGNLQGATRGLIAFDVLSVGPPSGSSVLPEVTVEIVDAVTEAGDGACEGEPTLLDDDQAPPLISSSEPSP